jgi:hypothetical protein
LAISKSRSANRRFKLQKRSQLLIRAHNETLSVGAVRDLRLQLHIPGPFFGVTNQAGKNLTP